MIKRYWFYFVFYLTIGLIMIMAPIIYAIVFGKLSIYAPYINPFFVLAGIILIINCSYKIGYCRGEEESSREAIRKINCIRDEMLSGRI